MNLWAAAIVAALLVELGLRLVADWLNLRALDSGVPVEFRDVYDPERYRRTQAYTRARTHFGIVTSVIDLAVLLAFWFAGGFGLLDRTLRALGLGPIATGLLFFAALGLGQQLVHLPARWWSTFVIEERFGFNRTSRRTFWADLARGALLAMVVGAPLLAAILWLFARAGAHAWLYCFLASTLFLVGLQYVAPTWILPLFNRFEPLAEGELKDAILSYARAVRFPVQGVFLIDGSRRSTKGNAFFTGFGRRRRIALFDTLVEQLGTSELVAVLAHEIGHAKRRHVLWGMAVAVAQLGVVFFLLSIALESRGLFAAFFVAEPSVHAGLVLFGLVLAPIELVLSIGLLALSRRHEREADEFAARTIGSGAPLASGLKRLSAESLSNLTPHPLHVLLHYSHPPLVARVRALAGATAAAATDAERSPGAARRESPGAQAR
ncbi:MAG TPA: M48 family metallopeptidase [Candidatus Bathyarchaeia archaeon]|nr:M48 family metallopeptidase [Candidatus Bathyarchaeia archaeon]